MLTIQDLIALNQPRFATRFNRLHYRAVMPRSLQNAARVLVSNAVIGAQVLRRAPRAQIRVVPLGVDEIFFRKSENKVQIAQKYALPPRFLLYVGNFEPKKNLPGLLRALELWPDAPPLVIAGELDEDDRRALSVVLPVLADVLRAVGSDETGRTALSTVESVEISAWTHADVTKVGAKLVIHAPKMLTDAFTPASLRAAIEKTL